jgi:hypothetical protein
MLPGSTGSGYSHLTIHGYALSSMRWINAEKGVGQRLLKKYVAPPAKAVTPA